MWKLDDLPGKREKYLVSLILEAVKAKDQTQNLRVVKLSGRLRSHLQQVYYAKVRCIVGRSGNLRLSLENLNSQTNSTTWATALWSFPSGSLLLVKGWCSFYPPEHQVRIYLYEGIIHEANNRFQARTLETDVDTVLGWLLES